MTSTPARSRSTSTFLAGNLLDEGGFKKVWQESELFTELRSPQTSGACTKCSFFDSCRGGCMAAKFFTGLPLDGPDPECVRGFGELALAQDRSLPEAESGPLADRAPDARTARDAPVGSSPVRDPRDIARLTARLGMCREPPRRLPAIACTERH